MPNKAITKNKNDVEGIRIMEGNELVFVPVDIIYTDGVNSVIEAADDTQFSPNEMLY